MSRKPQFAGLREAPRAGADPLHRLGGVSLLLIHGPPGAAVAAAARQRFLAAAERDPVLVVPTFDDAIAAERELCGDGALLGGAVMTFQGLFRAAAAAAGPLPVPELTSAQRLRVVAAGVESRLGGLGPLRRSASRPGFAPAFARLLDELQAAGLEPEEVKARVAGGGSAYLADLGELCAGYAEARERSGRVDFPSVAAAAAEALRRDPGAWAARPVVLYGFDDFTPVQFELLAAIAATGEVTLALPFAAGPEAPPARARLLARLRERIGVDEEVPLPAASESAPLLAHLARGFAAGGADGPPPDGDGLTLLRSAGTRGEAEAIATEVSRLLVDGAAPEQIAVVVRDPARRGPEIAAALEANGVATALEAELPVVSTAVGGALAALLEAEHGRRRAADLLRYLRGPSGQRQATVDWFERALRRRRVLDVEAALELWREGGRELPRDLTRLREAAARGPAALAAEAGRLAATMAARPLRGDGDGPLPARREGLELRAAGAIASALSELAELGPLAPRPEQLAATIAEMRIRAWSGPIEGRVRIAGPRQLRAARFDHVFVASLQEGEFPRRESGDPFLSEGQRRQLGLEPRRATDEEERHLFAACLALPRRRLFLSWRDSDEDGGAEARSPLLDEALALLAPAADPDAAAAAEAAITRGRDLATVVPPLAEAPSEDALARALAAHGRDADAEALPARAGVGEETAARLRERIAAARRREEASREPGPLRNPAVLESLARVEAYGGTTLEEFDRCSYRWFVSHELAPRPLGPDPAPLVQGGLAHSALHRLYEEKPEGEPLPRAATLRAWQERAREVVAALAAERGLGDDPAERAIVRRVERLLDRFLAEEAARAEAGGGFAPWLLEARFGEGEECDRPALQLGDWSLHGAIDRVDRDPRGRAVVFDYKLAGSVTPAAKFEQEAKLQLPLYMEAVERLWGGEAAAGLYHPLRGTRERRPRGLVREDAAAELAAYRPVRTDVLDRGEFGEALERARERATAIVARMRRGDIKRDPGPPAGVRGHDVCPQFCGFAPICRRDRSPAGEEEDEE